MTAERALMSLWSAKRSWTELYLLHTGSIATFLAPGAAVVRELLEQSHQRCVVTYDPDIRPGLLGSHFEAKTIFEELVPFTEVVKLSDEDALWLYPRLSLEAIPKRILELGAGLVAVTIGAGDAYMAALIYGLLMRGADGLAPSVLESLGGMAAKAAAITVRRAGAQPPTLEELQRDLPEHQPVAR